MIKHFCDICGGEIVSGKEIKDKGFMSFSGGSAASGASVRVTIDSVIVEINKPGLGWGGGDFCKDCVTVIIGEHFR